MDAFHVEFLQKFITTDDYIAGFRDSDKFIEYCKKCHNYNAKWSCPPYEFDTTEKITQYKNTYIVGAKVLFADAILNSDISKDEKTAVMDDAINQVRRKMDAAMLEHEQKYSGFAFFAGSCRICGLEECTRRYNKQCKHIEKIRPSLEAYGFDIGKTTAELLGIELKWGSAQNIPEYLVLTAALLTNETADISIE